MSKQSEQSVENMLNANFSVHFQKKLDARIVMYVQIIAKAKLEGKIQVLIVITLLLVLSYLLTLRSIEQNLKVGSRVLMALTFFVKYGAVHK